jgi:prepilin-type N-terminal cleavage/methylation domain-containing protein
MRCVSIGTPAASLSNRCDCGDKRAGFTLIEALVAMALVLTFIATLGPFLFHLRRIMDNAEQRMAAYVLLRTLLNAPFDRSHLASAVRDGELDGLRWRVVTRPIAVEAVPPGGKSWTSYRVDASVSSDAGEIVAAETIRLGTSQ